MARRQYNINNRKYVFSTAKYRNIYDCFKGKNHKLKVKDLDMDIAHKVGWGEETVKKWRNKGESGSTPTDLETVEKLAEYFSISVDDLLEPIEEGERKMNYNNFDEKEAVKRVVRSFVGLLKVFSKEKSKIQYEKLTVAEANYYERIIPEGEIEECDIYYDGSVFRYEKIEEKADEVRTELIVAAMDMPESIIKDLDFLLANIALGDETEKNFVHDEDFEEENYYGSCDCFNIGEVMQSVMGYYDNLMEILKPYNLGLEKYRALVY